MLNEICEIVIFFLQNISFLFEQIRLICNCVGFVLNFLEGDQRNTYQFGLKFSNVHKDLGFNKNPKWNSFLQIEILVMRKCVQNLNNTHTYRQIEAKEVTDARPNVFRFYKALPFCGILLIRKKKDSFDSLYLS